MNSDRLASGRLSTDEFPWDAYLGSKAGVGISIVIYRTTHFKRTRTAGSQNMPGIVFQFSHFVIAGRSHSRLVHTSVPAEHNYRSIGILHRK